VGPVQSVLISVMEQLLQATCKGAENMQIPTFVQGSRGCSFFLQELLKTERRKELDCCLADVLLGV